MSDPASRLPFIEQTLSALRKEIDGTGQCCVSVCVCLYVCVCVRPCEKESEGVNELALHWTMLTTLC